MKNVGEEAPDNGQQRCRQICGHLRRTFAARQHQLEELGGSCDVASFRDEHVDDLAVLVDSAVHVPPHTGHLHVGFIDEPSVADAVPAQPRRLDYQPG